MMTLLCKQKALYIKACVIANGITDSQGDTLQTTDIKKIFTSFNNQDNFELNHNNIPINEVSLIENYINATDEKIGNLIVPKGSWLVVIRVDNPEIKKLILNNEIQGISLYNYVGEKCKANLNGTVRYQDIIDKECVIPVFISFVEQGANGYPLHVMDYETYIQKSKKVKFMDFKEFIDGLKGLIKQAEEVEPVKDEKEEEPMTDEKENKKEDSTKEPVTEKETDKKGSNDKPVIEKEDKIDEKPVTENTEEKPMEKEPSIKELMDRITALENKIDEIYKEKILDDADDIVEETIAPKIVKSEKELNIREPVKVSNYYEMTNRDPVTGKKIRK